EKLAQDTIARIAATPHRPPPPLSQSIEEIADPYHRLDTHPDLVSRLWKLDDSLPRHCRHAFFGKPALVHPDTGVIFAVAYGTIGCVMRLPREILEAAVSEQAKVVMTGNPGQSFDIGPAGPEWRFVMAAAPEHDWCRAAYEFAGTPAT